MTNGKTKGTTNAEELYPLLLLFDRLNADKL
jgi:hypothetical protein